jgi:hypothetical protein
MVKASASITAEFLDAYQTLIPTVAFNYMKNLLLRVLNILKPSGFYTFHQV